MNKNSIIANKSLDNEAMKWIDNNFNNMTLEEKIGQLLCPIEINEKKLHKLIEKYNIGSIFIWDLIKNFRKSISSFQETSKLPLLVSADLEAGAGHVVRYRTKFPALMALGKVNSVDLAYKMGEATALEGLLDGINWSFSPVADIYANKENPITVMRAIDANYKIISKIAPAYIKGMQDHGMIATAKHFPGDGFDDRDQHLCTTTNPLTLAQWNKTSGYIFKKCIDANVKSIMIGHINLPSYDKSLLPGTLSEKIMKNLLTKKMNFNGLIVTDAIAMGGYTSHGTFNETIPLSIKCGAHIILFIDNIPNAVTSILKALDKKILSEKDIDSAVKQVLKLKASINLHKKRIVDEKEYINKIKKINPKKISATLSKKSINIMKNKKKEFPFKIKKSDKILIPVFNPELVGCDFTTLVNELKKYTKKVTMAKNPKHGQLLKMIEKHNIILPVLFYPSMWGTGTARITGRNARAFMSGFYKFDKKVVFLNFGNPNHLYEFPEIENMVLAYNESKINQINILKKIITNKPK